ncbi:hypothetical protein D3C87_1942650 [compost metagenome]
MACGGTKTAKVISHLQASDSWLKTPCMPPKAVFCEMIFMEMVLSSLLCWRPQVASETTALTAAATSIVLKKKETTA